MLPHATRHAQQRHHYPHRHQSTNHQEDQTPTEKAETKLANRSLFGRLPTWFSRCGCSLTCRRSLDSRWTRCLKASATERPSPRTKQEWTTLLTEFKLICPFLTEIHTPHFTNHPQHAKKDNPIVSLTLFSIPSGFCPSPLQDRHAGFSAVLGKISIPCDEHGSYTSLVGRA